MSKFLISVLIPLLLFGLLMSGISCSNTVIILPPSQTAAPMQTATSTLTPAPTQTATPIVTPLSSLDGDLHSVQTAVDTYAIQSNKWPTANGSLPPQGDASIDFNASFNKEGKTMSFYPHFISRLPKHSDEGVWRIDNAARVSVDIPRDKY